MDEKHQPQQEPYTSKELKTLSQKFYTQEEVRTILHSSRSALNRWIRTEGIPAYRIGEKKFLFPRVQFDEWLRGKVWDPLK